MAGKMRSEASSSKSSGGSGSSERGNSVVADCGRRRASCGYCRSGGRTSISHGLWAHSLTVDDYQDLLDRGWRRSGSFVYKPEMERTCCPSYTIRLKASDFVSSKEQLRVTRRMQRFLDGTLEDRNIVEHIANPEASEDTRTSAHNEASSSVVKESLFTKSKHVNEEENFVEHLSDLIDNEVHVLIGSGDFPNNIQFPRASVKRVSQAKRKVQVEGSENLLYSSNIAFVIASMIRRAQSGEKDVNKSNSSGLAKEEYVFSPKFVAEKLASSLCQVEAISGFSIRACNGHINFYFAPKLACLPESVQAVMDTKKPVAGCGSKRCSTDMSSECLQKKRRRLEILLKRSSFDPEEYALYRRYQIKVHNDTPDRVTESSYKRFLVDTPLISVPPTGDGKVPPCGFGSFHQQYMIDGKLIAVGVVDILPRCLSSKYLFWDPDFAFLSMGKYSALQEIDWVKQNQLHCASLQYYYLGYYIHSCSKMKYKAAYRPSELLCPLRYQWVPFDIAKPLLDKKPYVVLSDFPILQIEESSPVHDSKTVPDSQHDDVLGEDANDALLDEDGEMIEVDSESSEDDEPENTSLDVDAGDVNNILIGLRGSRLRYKELQRAFDPEERSYLENQLHRYKKVVGAELSERMVYSLS